MELFSEIYSCYYAVIASILQQKQPISKKEIYEIIENKAFKESAFYIMPKLISGEWNFLKECQGRYVPKLEGYGTLPLTALQKAWLKALLSDRRMRLFLKESAISNILEKLKNVKPMFYAEDFYYYDAFTDGDNYDNPQYIENFRRILAALKHKKVITISFESSKSGRITGNYMPLRLQYSSKDDKFRAYLVRIKNGRICTFAMINLGRIGSVTISKESFSGDIPIESYMKIYRCKEPVIIEISKERNALERCMLHFASYEKRTEYDMETDKHISYIYYDKQEETELLIRILSFGPVIKVLGPESFLKQIKERMNIQKKLLGGT